MNGETELLYNGTKPVRKETVIEKVTVIKELYTNLPQRKIGVAGICPGVGATFVTLALASAVERMGIRAGIKEMCEKVIEDIAGEASERFDVEYAPVMLHDFSGSSDPEDLLAQIGKMDKTVVVIDPLPSKIVKGYERFSRLKAEAPGCILVLNKTHREVKKKEIREIFACDEIFEIPFIAPQYIYAAEQKSILAADICFVRNETEETIKKMLAKILPEEILLTARNMVK